MPPEFCHYCAVPWTAAHVACGQRPPRRILVSQRVADFTEPRFRVPPADLAPRPDRVVTAHGEDFFVVWDGA